MASDTLRIRSFAQIADVEVRFGDLTVLVGAQGTGKSLVLQWLKLAVDELEVRVALEDAGFAPNTAAEAAEAYFGEGMGASVTEQTSVTFRDRTVLLKALTRRPKARNVGPKMFLIPAHRALLLADGWPAPFSKLGADTPVVARLYSQALFEQLSRHRKGQLFPRDRVLVKAIREAIDAAVFHGGRVELRQEGLRRQLRLRYGDEGGGLPFMTWTAGQREFTPMLLGLYRVLPERSSTRVPGLDWVVVEEPEMGLHPKAISAVMLLVIDLLWRGYRVVLSTHSPMVLEAVWAIRQFADSGGQPRRLARAFGLTGLTQGVVSKFEAAMQRDLSVVVLRHSDDGKVLSRDISALDPGSDDAAERDWGGLTEFASSVSAAVSMLPEVP